MKFNVNSTELVGKISILEKLSIRGGMKDFVGFGKMKIESTKDDLIISIFNGQVSAELKLNNLNSNIEYEFSSQGVSTVDAGYFIGALSSFRDGEKVIVEKNDNEIKISKMSDLEEFNTVTTFTEELEFPPESDKEENSIEINKEILFKAISNIKFAFGKEDTKPKFKHFVMRCDKDYIRFASGTGSVFAINTYNGESVNVSDESVDITFNCDIMEKQILNVLKIMSDKVSIKTFDKNGNYQMMFSDENYKIRIFGLDSDIQFVDEGLLLKKSFDSKFITNIKDWEYAIKGTMATFTDQMKKECKPHKSQLEFNLSDKVISLKIDQALKTKRKIAIIDGVCEKGSHECSSYSSYIENIANCRSGSGNVQIECESGTGNKVIAVYYDAGDKVVQNTEIKISNSAGYDEQFILLFLQIV